MDAASLKGTLSTHEENFPTALPVMLDVVRGPDRLPADEELKEMLRGKLRILQVDSSKVNALFKTIPQFLRTHKKPSRSHSGPFSQGSAPDQSVLLEEREQTLEDMRGDIEVLTHKISQFPDLATRWQQINQEMATLRHQISWVPELVSVLEEESTELWQQFQRLVTEIPIQTC
ncbi:SH3 domain and tetratricopeptide repeat-containing protein 1-like protein [Lates japonicus]|uniref:SH3 domain and tetratricopeptide repeat-containing protein 1-like protein n=1 Tax=Lates japonicus TaxID=270547 RepID=A0AAD3NGU8_LATJO|nr:SH3 domain and tetratricopeptide repeat-containing protein 1-like protein [Lates japonicus]